MMDMISNILSFLRKPSPQVVFALTILSGSLLFLPSRFLSLLGLDELTETYKPFIGTAFLFSVVLLLVQLVSWQVNKIRKWLTERKVLKTHIAYLSELTPEEKRYLIPYIVDDVNTRHFHPEDGVAMGLQGKDILYSSEIGDILKGFAHNIQPWAKKELKARPELLKIP